MSEWISVKDELPPLETSCYSITVIVCAAENVGMGYFVLNEDGDARWVLCDEAWGIEEPTVTHWMPLPDPPL